MQILRLLAVGIESYNRGESSSVQVEAAQSIMESIFYTIGLTLKSMPNVAFALDAVKKEPVQKLYEQGCRLIQTKLKTAKHLHRLVCQTKVQTANESYNATIEEFFTTYNPEFEAQEIPASIDYQLANPVTDLAGVEFVIQYLQNLYTENLFCAKFDAGVLHEVMIGYDAGYKDLLVNLFSQALQNALGCSLLKKDILTLRIDPAEIKKLKRMLVDQTKTSLHELLRRESDKLIAALSIQNTATKNYIYATLPELSTRLHEAVFRDAVHTFFPPRPTALPQPIHYSMGKKTDDAEYRSILIEIFSCRNLGDKMQIIKESMKSLADIEDLLRDGEFTEAETFAVLGMLEDIDIAVLISRHPLCLQPDEADDSETEASFLSHFKCYLQNISAEKLKELQETASSLEIE
jgi:hypothetical protein